MPGSDGFGDTPISVDGSNNIDLYPLMEMLPFFIDQPMEVFVGPEFNYELQAGDTIILTLLSTGLMQLLQKEQLIFHQELITITLLSIKV